jgi:hypothetical protein
MLMLDVWISYGNATFTTLLHIWELAFQNPQNANQLMTVAPFPRVEVGSEGAAGLQLAFRHIDVPAPNEWPPTRCVCVLCGTVPA